MDGGDAAQIRLEWPGKHDVAECPVARLELVRAGSSACTLVQGDNLGALRALGERHAGAVTLAYLDPPFFTGKEHVRITRKREGRGKILRSAAPAFDDRRILPRPSRLRVMRTCSLPVKNGGSR